MKRFWIPLTLLFGYTAQSQQTSVGQPTVDIEGLLPKSPQSSQLFKVNQFDISAKGTPPLVFTLYTARVGDISIPISVKYDASGIKYDDVPSVVGLKWNLDAGGEVSRNINGQPDENTNCYFSYASQYTFDYFNGMDLSYDSTQSYLSGIANGHLDAMQDEYSYNFLNRSGYFYFKNNKFWDCKQPFTFRISPPYNGSSISLGKFLITDEFGNNFSFGHSYTDLTNVIHGGSGYVVPTIPTNGVTAWKVDTIKTYHQQTATFEYETYSYEITKLASEAYTKRAAVPQPPDPSGYYCNCGNSVLSQDYIIADFNINVPTHIHTPSEEIQFYYSVDTVNYSLFKKRLDSITIKDKVTSALIKKIQFKYDKYSNANLLRLNAIWEKNSSSDSLLIAQFGYKTDYLDGISSNSRDIFNYYNDESNTHLISTDDADYTNYFTSANRSINPYAITAGVLDSIYYPTGGKTVFYYGANKIGDYYGPGIRVDSISYLNGDNSIASRTHYNYTIAGIYFNGTVNNISYNSDNSDCPLKTFGSEFSAYDPTQPFYYSSVETRRIGTDTLLTKETFTTGSNNYIGYEPIPDQKIVFGNNSLTDTLSVESFNYSSVHLDSLGADWIKPGLSYLPAAFYPWEGGMAYNVGICNTLYYNVGARGVIIPRNTLVAKHTTKNFDQNTSSQSITNTITCTYNDKWQKISDSRFNSKGNLDSTYFTYLHSSPGSLSTNISNDNLYGLVTKTTRFTNSNTQLEQSRVSYSAHSSLILPDSFFVKSLSNSEIFDKMITGYDANGLITEVDNKHGFYFSMIRDYNNEFLIAEAKNAPLSQVAYTSFEADSKGGWTYSGNTSSDATSPTGSHCYNLSGGNITKSSLANTTYIVSYWSKSGAFSINGSSTPTRTGKTIGSWTYYEHEVSSTSITVSGGNYIDELRLYPKGAQMTTYAYSPLVGLQSQCDADNRITYYEYDAFGRLRLLKDQDKNILKVFDYQYKQAQNQ